MDRLQEQYTEYAFIDDPHVQSGAVSVPATGLAGAFTKCAPYMLRTYEGCKWYFIVFKPFNRAYDKAPSWFMHKGLEKCSTKVVSPEFALYTREKNAAKVHINGLVCYRGDLDSLHDRNFGNKYKLHISELHTLSDRQNVLKYICKEEFQDNNTWTLYEDYRIKIK